MLSIDTSGNDALALPKLSLNDSTINSSDINNSSNNTNAHLCPPFPSEEVSLAYLRSITPPRDLHCPITQELFQDPVVAVGDGQTYERSAILTWFNAQMRNHHGSIRSPVTNAYMSLDGMNGTSTTGTTNSNTSTPITTIVENKAVAAMVQNAREVLGKQLCQHCESIWRYTNNINNIATQNNVSMDHVLGDGGFRIRGLVEAGADLSLRECTGGHSALMMLILSKQIDLVNFFISYDAPIHDMSNDKGKTSVQLIQQIILEQHTQSSSPSASPTNPTNTQYWKDLEQTLSELEITQKKKKEAKSNARNTANAQIRERQRVLATNARAEQNEADEEVGLNGRQVRHQLGSLEEGWGYFPSLAALQFQGAVPSPSASFADYENREKKRLRLILGCISSSVFLFLVTC